MSVMKTARQCRERAIQELRKGESAHDPLIKAGHVALSGEWLAMARMADLHIEMERNLRP